MRRMFIATFALWLIEAGPSRALMLPSISLRLAPFKLSTPALTRAGSLKLFGPSLTEYLPLVPEFRTPAPVVFLPLESDQDPPPDQVARIAEIKFDGARTASSIEWLTALPTIAAPAGSGLSMTRTEHKPWLAAVVKSLLGTRTGRRILRDIDYLREHNGRPILLDIQSITNNGEFRYDSELIVMDAGHLKRDPRQSAPILGHELQHVLQRAMRLPADALDLDIESSTVENRIWDELRVEPVAGSFARQARVRIKKDFPLFVKWLQKQYTTAIPLYGSRLEVYVARLKGNLAATESAAARIRQKIKKVELVLISMVDNHMTETTIKAHARDDLDPQIRRLQNNTILRNWIERDLKFLSTVEGRRLFQAYSRGVIRRARALSRS